MFNARPHAGVLTRQLLDTPLDSPNRFFADDSSAGVFGFLAHPELSAESVSQTSGMMGLEDCIAVLKWVNANISTLGGDPGKVTIGGQSAGSAKALILSLSPWTQGLVHGVIMQSGVRSPRDPTISNGPPSYRLLKDAERAGVETLGRLGIENMAQLRAFNDVGKLTQLSRMRDTSLWGPPPFWRAVLDGHVLRRPYTETLSQPPGPRKDIPVMIGYNSNEGMCYNEPRFTMEDFRQCVEQRLGAHNVTRSNGSASVVDRFMELYEPADDVVGKGPLDAWNRSTADSCRAHVAHFAKMWSSHTTSPIFAYYFSHAPPAWRGWKPDYSAPKTDGFTNMKGPVTGAYHGAELSYVFNSLKQTERIRPWTDKDYQAADMVSTLWANFIKYGNPNGARDQIHSLVGKAEASTGSKPEEASSWPDMRSDPHTFLHLGPGDGRIRTADRQEAINFWMEYLESQEGW